MQDVWEIDRKEIDPALKDVIETDGMNDVSQMPDRVQQSLQEAFLIFKDLAQPKAVVSPISLRSLQEMLQKQEEKIPIQKIAREAQQAALFVITLGPKVGEGCTQLFTKHEYAKGYFLDSIASAAVDKAADFVQSQYAKSLGPKDDHVILRYSPGYCGWHLSSQKDIFAYVGPERMSVSLNSSYLMYPIKSLSGVFLEGPASIHLFENDYPFCKECKSCTCRKRMAEIRRTHGNLEKNC